MVFSLETRHQDSWFPFKTVTEARWASDVSSVDLRFYILKNGDSKLLLPSGIQGGHVLDLWISSGCVMGDVLRMDSE